MKIGNEHRDGEFAGYAERLLGSTKRVTMSLTERIGRCCRGEEGSTIAEMAMVLPVMLAVLTGVFSFGVALNQYLVLTNAVNNGARAFAMSAPAQDGGTSIMDSGDPCKYAAETVEAATANLNTSTISYTITYTLNSSGVATTYTGSGSSKPTCSGLAMHQMDIVQVQAVYPVTPALYGWTSRSLSLTATSTEMVQ